MLILYNRLHKTGCYNSSNDITHLYCIAITSENVINTTIFLHSNDSLFIEEVGKINFFCVTLLSVPSKTGKTTKVTESGTTVPQKEVSFCNS